MHKRQWWHNYIHRNQGSVLIYKTILVFKNYYCLEEYSIGVSIKDLMLCFQQKLHQKSQNSTDTEWLGHSLDTDPDWSVWVSGCFIVYTKCCSSKQGYQENHYGCRSSEETFPHPCYVPPNANCWLVCDSPPWFVRKVEKILVLTQCRRIIILFLHLKRL